MKPNTIELIFTRCDGKECRVAAEFSNDVKLDIVLNNLKTNLFVTLAEWKQEEKAA